MLLRSKAYDSVTGDDVTVNLILQLITESLLQLLKLASRSHLAMRTTPVIDTTKFAFGRYYKFDIPTTVKQSVAAGVDIETLRLK